MTTNRQPRIVIIGAGPAALTLALNLHAASANNNNNNSATPPPPRYDLTIYESRASTAHESGSMVLTPNAARALDHVGIYTSLLPHSFQHDGVDFVDNTTEAKRMARLILGGVREFGYPALRTYRETVRSLLLQAVWEKGMDVRFGMKCVDVRDEGTVAEEEAIAVSFENGETTHADVVIGADGMYSRTRRFVDPNATVTYSGQAAIVAFAKTASLPEPTQLAVCNPVAIFGPEGSLFIMPVGRHGEDTMFFTMLEIEDRSREEWTQFETDRQGMREMLWGRFCGRGWPDVCRDLIDKGPLERYIAWPFRYVDNVSTFSSPNGRVVLMGDAAHAIPPSAGQSGAMAIEDAETLSSVLIRALSPACSSSSSPSSSPSKKEESPQSFFFKINSAELKEHLGRWERHRRERIEKVVERTREGSHVRRGVGELLEKRGRMDDGDGSGSGLEWLYGYDGSGFERKVLDVK